MRDERRRAFEIGVRRIKGARILPVWLESINRVCGTALTSSDLLDLDETETLKYNFYQIVKARTSRFCRYWPREACDEVMSVLSDLSNSVDGLPVLLFSIVDSYIGAIKVPADAVLSHAKAVWDTVDEDLSITTFDLQHGMCLEFNYNTPTGEYVKEGVYELTAWGALEPRISDEQGRRCD